MLTRKVRSRSVVANRWDMSRSTSTRFDRGTMTSRVGLSWSDSSRRSSTIGSFFASICCAICSSTFEPETWYGRAVTTIAPSSRSKRARIRTLPDPPSYIAISSSRGVTISASVGKSGPRTCSHSSATDASGSSRSRTQARAISRALCGGTSVAMPTAIPAAPFNRTCGSRAGSSTGSSRVPSKFDTQSTVPSRSSRRRISANRVSLASV